MYEHMNSVSVIIATTCETKRRHSLFKAVRSVLDQEGANVDVIAVVNGGRVDCECLQELRLTPGVKVIIESVGSYPKAIQIGRKNVVAPFFGFLDDDDEYLPNAVANRIGPLLSDSSLAFVASNGLRRLGDVDHTVVKDADLANKQPLQSLARENWLASCGGLFRSSSIGPEFFDGKTAHLEWTFIAYKLALTKTSMFVNIPTFIINDSAGSLSKSDAYSEAEADVLPKILSLELPISVNRAVKEKLGRALHNIASRKSEKGEWFLAWRFHIASVLCRGGWKYLLYTRKLILPRRSQS